MAEGRSSRERIPSEMSDVESLNPDDDLEQILRKTKLTMIEDRLTAFNVTVEALWDLDKKQLEAIGLNAWEITRYFVTKEKIKGKTDSGS